MPAAIRNMKGLVSNRTRNPGLAFLYFVPICYGPFDGSVSQSLPCVQRAK